MSVRFDVYVPRGVVVVTSVAAAARCATEHTGTPISIEQQDETTTIVGSNGHATIVAYTTGETS